MKKNSDNRIPRQNTRLTHRIVVLVGLIACMSSQAASKSADHANTAPVEFDISPLAFYWRAPTRDEAYFRALAPFIEYSKSQNHTLHALPRPIFVAFETSDEKGFDLVWPIVTARFRKDGYSLRALTYLHTRKPDDDSRQRSRDWLIPLAFTGTNNHGDRYAALFPLWGDIHNIAGFDSLSFRLFPLYLATQKGAAESHTLFWPVFSQTTAENWSKWRIFPFYGIRQDTTGHNRRQFALWPFIHWANHRHGQRGSRAWFFFPFLGHSSATTIHTNETKPNGHSTTILWPLFYMAQAPGIETIHAPWPFIQISQDRRRNSARKKLYLWPLWGRSETTTRHYQFIAWPIAHKWRSIYDEQTVEKSWIIPLYRREKTSTIHGQRQTDQLQIWPLFRRSWKDTGKTHLQTLALWPMAPNPLVDRLFTPLFTVFEHHRADNGDTQGSILWNTVSWKSTASDNEFKIPLLLHWRQHRKKTSFSLLHGLISYDPTTTKHLQLLYLLKL